MGQERITHTAPAQIAFNILSYLKIAYSVKGGGAMRTTSILVRLSASLKKKLEPMREEGVTASGLIRNLVEQHIAREKPKRKRAG